MNNTEEFLTKMLDHIEDHRKAYDNWTNRDIAKAWMKIAQAESQKSAIPIVTQWVAVEDCLPNEKEASSN
jgi:hypothetical protein